eukprot:9007754-Alexandrium_andersonii.AAC.1
MALASRDAFEPNALRRATVPSASKWRSPAMPLSSPMRSGEVSATSSRSEEAARMPGRGGAGAGGAGGAGGGAGGAGA